MYALYDTKAEIYDTPMFMLNEVMAKRWFYSMVQKAEGRFEFYSHEMEIHELGKVNVLNGKVLADKPKVILQGKQIGKEKKENEDSNAA